MSNIFTKEEIQLMQELLILYTEINQSTSMKILSKSEINKPLTHKKELELQVSVSNSNIAISVLEKLSDAFEAAEMSKDRVLH
jgi:hypothetical protein